MAKIEIFETEDDVKREGIKAKARRANAIVDIGLFSGTLFTSMGIFDILLDKSGLTKTIRESKFSKWCNKHLPSHKPTEKWLEKNMRTMDFSIGGMFLLLAGIGLWKAKKAEDELKKLDKEERHTIIPNNLSTEALGHIPIGSVDTFKLHKTTPDKIKSYTDRVLQDVGAEATRTL